MSQSEKKVIHEDAGMHGCDKTEGKAARSEQEKTNTGVILREACERNKTKGDESAREKKSKDSKVRDSRGDSLSQLIEEISRHRMRMKGCDPSEERYKQHKKQLKKLEDKRNVLLNIDKINKSEGSGINSNTSNEKEPGAPVGLGKSDFRNNQKMHNNKPSGYYSSESETKTNDSGCCWTESMPSIKRPEVVMNNTGMEVLYDLPSMVFEEKMEQRVASKNLTNEGAAREYQNRYSYQQRRKHSSSGEVVVWGNGSKVMMNNKDKEALYDMQSMAFGSKMEKLVADKALTDEEAAIQHQERYFYQQRRRHSCSSGEVVIRGNGSKVMMNNKDKEALYDMQSMAFGSKMEKLVADKALTDEEAAIQHQERYFYQQRRRHSCSSGEVVKSLFGETARK